MAFGSLENGAIGLCVCSADFSFSLDLNVVGCELDVDDGSDETGFCWWTVEDWILGN